MIGQWQLENEAGTVCDWLDGTLPEIIQYVFDRASELGTPLTLTDGALNKWTITPRTTPQDNLMTAKERNLITLEDDEIEFCVKLTWKNYILACQYDADKVSAYAEYALYNKEYSRRWQAMTPDERAHYLALRKDM
jgi:hypothetical protein